MSSQTILDPVVITKHLINTFNSDGTTKKDKQLYKYHRIHSKTKNLSHEMKIGEYYYFSKDDMNKLSDYSSQNPINFNINDSFLKHPFIHHFATPKSKRIKYNLSATSSLLSSVASTKSSLTTKTTATNLTTNTSSSTVTENTNFYENRNTEKIKRILYPMVQNATKDPYLIGASSNLMDSAVALCKYTLLNYGLLEKEISEKTMIEHIKLHLDYSIKSIKKLKLSVEVTSDSSITSDLPQSLFGKKKRVIQPPTPPTPF